MGDERVIVLCISEDKAWGVVGALLDLSDALYGDFCF